MGRIYGKYPQPESVSVRLVHETLNNSRSEMPQIKGRDCFAILKYAEQFMTQEMEIYRCALGEHFGNYHFCCLKYVVQCCGCSLKV
jgi:hypothetical protein